jgi:hypothetical protein
MVGSLTTDVLFFGGIMAVRQWHVLGLDMELALVAQPDEKSNLNYRS